MCGVNNRPIRQVPPVIRHTRDMTDLARSDLKLRLTRNRLLEFQHLIPAPEVPELFQEAVRTTHFLGFRYLWIDSLCIIQDLPSDWAFEAARMAAVYINAVCNLAFLFPADLGFRRTRDDPRKSCPCIVRNSTPGKRSSCDGCPFGAVLCISGRIC